MRTARILMVLVLASLAAPLSGGQTPELDVAHAYSASKSAPVTYDIDFRVIVTAPSGTRTLKVWVPMAQDDAGQKIEPGEWSVFPAQFKPTIHTEKVFGNRFAFIEIQSPHGAQIIAYKFKATVWQLDWDVDAGKVARVQKLPASFDPYRRAESGIVIDDRVRKLASGLEGKGGPAGDLGKIMEWVQENMIYDHSATSLVASTDHALTKKRGDCSDYHGLCSSLGRALGLPTRVTYGLHLFPKNLPCHCKLEVYLHPYGWVSFDVSETQRLIHLIEGATDLTAAKKKDLVAAAAARLHRGFRDNTWLLVTKGTDYELAPPASAKAPLVPTIYAEADGKPLPLPDPADPTKREFSWMTAHKYSADRAVTYPFRDMNSLMKK